MFAQAQQSHSNPGQATKAIADSQTQASLKRSSSAPMINEISSAMSMSSPTTSVPPRDTLSTYNMFMNMPRARRFSTSSPGGGVTGVGPRLAPRINQLRREECIDVVAGREAAHEKEIHCAMQMSQSWEDLTFETEGLSFKDSSTDSPPPSVLSGSSVGLKQERQLVSKKAYDQLSLNLSGGSPSCSSPSPTRSLLNQRHCYSPSFSAVNWKNGSLSPSPTRKAFATRRSLSPISIRPSCLGGNSGLKRKFELDETVASDKSLHPPAKRISLLAVHNPTRIESNFCGFSSVNSKCGGSVGTPESSSSADSSHFSNLLPDHSPLSNRTILHNDDTMSDSSNDQQFVKPMESEPILVSNEESCSSDNR